jgi:hypothetical protein
MLLTQDYDAAQISNVDLDKKDKNVFSFKFGGIENLIINKGIVDILEGTKPAFNNQKINHLNENLN